MRFTKFEIKNFRGIQKACLDLNKNPKSNIYTLVGLNESGKTTILEAINHFEYKSETLAPLKLSGYNITDQHSLIPMSQRANFNDIISIQYNLILDEHDEVAIKNIIKQKLDIKLTRFIRTIEITRKIGFKDSIYSKDNSINIWGLDLYGKKIGTKYSKDLDGDDWKIAVDCIDSFIPSILYFPNFLFEFPERIYLEDTGKEDEVHKFYRSVLQDILDALDNGTNVEMHMLKRAKSGNINDRKNLNSLLLEMGRNVTLTIFDLWNRIFHEEMGQKRIILDCDRDENNHYYIQFKIEDNDGFYFIKERSLGFRWFFVFLLLTQYRGFRKKSARNVLFLFDEPASNLHPTAQAKLLESFKSLAKRCYIIYTTHSHHLINPDWLETTYVVKNNGLNYKTDVVDYSARKTDINITPYRNFVVTHPNETTYYQPILDVLDYYPSRLELIPHSVILEGKNDYYILRFAQLILGDINYTKINIIPGTSSSNMDPIIKLYIGWGQEFVVLLDSDKEGKKQKKRYEALFESMLNDRIFTLEQIDPLWSNYEIETLFENDEKLIIQRICYPNSNKYLKKYFDRSIQELLLTKKTVTLSQKTMNKFKKLFDFLLCKINK